MIVKTTYKCDQLRENGLIYTRANFQSMKKHILEHNDQCLGQVQPQSGQFTINLSNASHKIHDLFIDVNGEISLDIEPLQTSKGIQVFNNYSIKELDFRPRGTGHVQASGYINNYNFITWDVYLKKS